jgi:adenylate kinase
VVPGARLVIFGKQGAGKGTQAARLSRHYVIPHISTGDMFRAAVRERTEFGRKADTFMKAGELVPDEVVIGVVRERLERDDTRARGFLLDGFPRSLPQAEALEEMLGDRGIDLVINLEVPTDVVLKRLAGRRVCEDCGTNYSVNAPPTVDWICDVCGGKVVLRDDDTEEAIARRLLLYEEQTEPLIAWYLAKDKLATVDGDAPLDDVTQHLIRVIDRRVRQG